jgi:hypothetical protein
MTQGYSGSFGVNGVNLLLQPTSFKWVEKTLLGIDGQGRRVYPAIKEFELNWGIMSTTDLAQLINLQLSIDSTGSVVSDLPKWGDTGYLFYGYSGTYVSEPTVGEYFNTYVQDVVLVISNIRV